MRASLRIRCESLTTEFQPWRFDACGLNKVVERGMPSYGDDTVIPSEVWPDVVGFLNDLVGVSDQFRERDVFAFACC